MTLITKEQSTCRNGLINPPFHAVNGRGRTSVPPLQKGLSLEAFVLLGHMLITTVMETTPIRLAA